MNEKNIKIINSEHAFKPYTSKILNFHNLELPPKDTEPPIKHKAIELLTQ